ncbi:MAG TPA: hypothetical protein VFB08_14960 [Burkholderiales bacterium]|nr:hypothetical protein [Burkholderiales bacterium]
MKKTLSLIPLAFVAACATTPTGPSVMVLPGSGKTFDQFRFDDNECRQFALTQSGAGTADSAAADSGMKSAAVGAAVGALAGAAITRSGHGAVAGAGLGGAGGAIAGTGAASQTAHTVQGRYDIAYQQCMYSKGNQIPMAASRYQRSAPPPASYQSAPPPPPPSSGTTPPPPPPPRS